MSETNKIDDGGPAFPCEGGDASGLHPSYGMTYRDWLAGQIVAGIASNREHIKRCNLYVEEATGDDGDTTQDRVAATRDKMVREAWAIADAMLAARNGGGK